MNRRVQASLVSLMMAAISGAVFAQSGVNVPLQRGVSVQLAVTSNAVAVPNADGAFYPPETTRRSTLRPTLAFRMHASLRLSMRCKSRVSKV
jgi:hypothetical protein